MNFLIIAIIFTSSSLVFAGPGGTGGGEVRDVAYFNESQEISTGHEINSKEKASDIYMQIENDEGPQSKYIIENTDGSYNLALFELERYFPIAKLETVNGEIITKEMMPSHYPLSNIQSIEMKNGEVLFADEILELLTNDHQNSISI